MALLSLLFADIHTLGSNRQDFQGALAIGLLLGVARLTTGSTYLAIGLNSAFNLVAMVQVVLYLYTPS